jgi:hypothetical protein
MHWFWTAPHPDRGRRSERLDALRVRVATERLEMRAQEHDVPAQVLLRESKVRRDEGGTRRTLGFNLVQTHQAVGLPRRQGN